MGIIRWVIDVYWKWLLEIPLLLLAQFTGIELMGLWAILAKVVLSLILLYIVYSVMHRVRRSVRKMFATEALYDKADAAALAAYRQGGDEAAAKVIASVADVEAAVAPMKKAKDYNAVAEAYAAAGRHKEAAKWLRKAGKRREAAMALARAGATVKAAKLLLKEGDFETAGRFFSEKGKHVRAAKAYASGLKLALAAEAYGRAGKYGEAADAYTEYFANVREDMEHQVAAAEKCYALLENETARAEMTPEQHKNLIPALAARFEQAKRYDLAASMLRETGDLAKAGEVRIAFSTSTLHLSFPSGSSAVTTEPAAA